MRYVHPVAEIADDIESFEGSVNAIPLLIDNNKGSMAGPTVRMPEQPLDHQFQSIRSQRIIGRGNIYKIALGAPNTLVEGGINPLARLIEQMNARILSSRFPQKFQGTVGRPRIDNDALPVWPGLFNDGV
jgi:hypothetical protein